MLLGEMEHRVFGQVHVRVGQLGPGALGGCLAKGRNGEQARKRRVSLDLRLPQRGVQRGIGCGLVAVDK